MRRRSILAGAAAVVLLGLVAAVFFGLRHDRVPGPDQANLAGSQCRPGNDRDLLGTDCHPTKAQVASYAHVPIGESATDFTSTFVSFQDSRLEATFMIRPSDLPTYLSLPDYPGVKLDRPSRQIHDPVTGQYRQLDLISKATGIEVRLVVFTT